MFRYFFRGWSWGCRFGGGIGGGRGCGFFGEEPIALTDEGEETGLRVELHADDEDGLAGDEVDDLVGGGAVAWGRVAVDDADFWEAALGFGFGGDEGEGEFVEGGGGFGVGWAEEFRAGFPDGGTGDGEDFAGVHLLFAVGIDSVVVEVEEAAEEPAAEEESEDVFEEPADWVVVRRGWVPWGLTALDAGHASGGVWERIPGGHGDLSGGFRARQVPVPGFRQRRLHDA